VTLYSDRRYYIKHNYLLQGTLSRENSANYLLCMLHTSLSGGTTLQPTICCDPPYLAIVGYNRLSAALRSILLGETIADSLLLPVRSTLIGDTTLNITIYWTLLSRTLCSVWSTILYLVVQHYNRLSATLCSIVFGETTAYSVLRSTLSDYLLRSICCICYLLRSILSGDTILQQSIYCTVLCSTVSGETIADNPLHPTLCSNTAADSLLRSPLSVKTILQPTIRSARHHSTLADETNTADCLLYLLHIYCAWRDLLRGID
jgi:hypothetical protein